AWASGALAVGCFASAILAFSTTSRCAARCAAWRWGSQHAPCRTARAESAMRSLSCASRLRPAKRCVMRQRAASLEFQPEIHNEGGNHEDTDRVLQTRDARDAGRGDALRAGMGVGADEAGR